MQGHNNTWMRAHANIHTCTQVSKQASTRANITRYPDGPDRIQDKIIELGRALPLKLVKATGTFTRSLSILVRFSAIVDIPYTTNTATFAELYASAVPSVVLPSCRLLD